MYKDMLWKFQCVFQQPFKVYIMADYFNMLLFSRRTHLHIQLSSQGIQFYVSMGYHMQIASNVSSSMLLCEIIQERRFNIQLTEGNNYKSIRRFQQLVFIFYAFVYQRNEVCVEILYVIVEFNSEMCICGELFFAQIRSHYSRNVISGLRVAFSP